MMAADYRHIGGRENRLGRHYSRFSGFWLMPSLQSNHLLCENRRTAGRIGEDGLDRNFCPQCGARVFTSNLGAFPGMIFVTLGSLDNAEGIAPVLEMFTKRRLKWAKPLDLPQFEN